MSRLFWFAVGGVSAFWWIRKHDEGYTGRWHQTGDEAGRRAAWHCMKHSWRRRDEGVEGRTDPGRETDITQMDKEVEIWKQEAKEKLAKALETGLDGAIGIIANLEAAFNERNRPLAAERQKQAEWREPLASSSTIAPQDSPSSPASSSIALPEALRSSAENIKRSTDPATSGEAQVLSQILVAIEKLNTKLDEQSAKKSDPSDMPRLV